MFEKFQNYIAENSLCSLTDKIMLAVSGGRDSLVMTDLFYKAGYDCIVLHCNFQLRASESDGDEAFVRSVASQYEFPVYVEHFDTESYADEHGISIQMAARALRYRWFNEISKAHHVEHIATAHTLNDSVETALLNLSRGTGIKGITGIPLVNGIYFRPLLFASRTDIDEYCRTQGISFREDSSNASNKYQRNKIRHELIPVFEEINPSFIHSMQDNMKRFRESYQIFQEEIEKQRRQLFIQADKHIEIDLPKLKKLLPLSTWLYELFTPYGFSMDQCLNMENILDSDSGKQFISPGYRLFKDRNKLLLFKSEDQGFKRYYIDSPESKATLPFSMDMELLERKDLHSFPDNEKTAVFDLDTLDFPLILRKWQHGDYFFPLGMELMKKVSDYFIDEKIPVPIKKNTWLLCSGKKIIWIVGLRIDNRFKITSKTRKVLRLQLYD